MEKKFYSISEIQEILGCSYTKAEEIAHMFLMQGKGIVHGKMIRVQIAAFNKWARLEV